MPRHLLTLGFPVTTEQDFRHYVYQASEFGQKIETTHGSYTQWALDNGIELWVQTNLHKRIIGMNPHFSGGARMSVDLTRRIPRYEHSILDGAFYGWVDPRTDDTESGQYPLVFDLPDYDVHDTLQLPYTATVQVAAFAHDLKGFESEETYLISQRGSIQFAAVSFFPSGAFIPGKGVKEPPQAEAIFSGRVLNTKLITNPVTGQRFYWARVHTLGGEVDVVADPQVVRGRVVTDGIIHGSFWISGRLM